MSLKNLYEDVVTAGSSIGIAQASIGKCTDVGTQEKAQAIAAQMLEEQSDLLTTLNKSVIAPLDEKGTEIARLASEFSFKADVEEILCTWKKNSEYDPAPELLAVVRSQQCRALPVAISAYDRLYTATEGACDPQRLKALTKDTEFAKEVANTKGLMKICGCIQTGCKKLSSDTREGRSEAIRGVMAMFPKQHPLAKGKLIDWFNSYL